MIPRLYFSLYLFLTALLSDYVGSLFSAPEKGKRIKMRGTLLLLEQDAYGISPRGDHAVAC